MLAPDDSVEADVAALLSDWQEYQAIQDDGSVDHSSMAEQQRMMKSWRNLVANKERQLLQSKRSTLDKDSSIPAYLTGWLVEGETTAATRPKAFSPSSSAGEADAALELESGAPEPGDTEVEAVIEAEAEDADTIDDQFVADWQLQAERERAVLATERAGVTIKPASFFQRWQGTRHGDFNGGDDAFGGEGGQSIGIDLGTTNCAVACVGKDGQPEILPTADGERVFPSIVSFLTAAPTTTNTNTDGEALRSPLIAPDSDACVVVGERARRQQLINPYSTFSSTKRLIGRTASAAELKQLQALDVPHSVVPNTREVLLACPALRRAISPVSVAAELVRELVAQAESCLETNVTAAVVTVPAYFDDSQRCATETACLLAGLERVRLLREPESAALSYALASRRNERIMVFDLGGGTFDVSILDVGSGVVEVIASSGDPRLGGNDWDREVAQWLEDLFIAEHGLPLDGFARRRLLDAAEAAKVALSSEATTQVEVPFLVGQAGLNVTLSRRKFEALCRKLLLRLVQPMREVAEVAGLELDEANMGTLIKGNQANAAPRVQQWQQQVAWRWRRMAQRTGGGASLNRPLQGVPITKVLLVGGATRMPSIGRFIKRMTGLPAKPTVQPEEAVALGAAVQAGILDNRVATKVFNPYGHDRAAQNLADHIPSS